MPEAATAALLEPFAEIVRLETPLAPFTHLKIGGPAEVLVQPRSLGELSRFMQAWRPTGQPMRVLGSGCNLLISDAGVRGAVIRLVEPAFTQVVVEGHRVKAGAGAALAVVISEAARNGLAGLETLVGIPGTLGGAIRVNAGDRAGEIGPLVARIHVLDENGLPQIREREEIRFAYRSCSIDEPVILSAELQLELELPETIVKRLRKAWIQRKAGQPLSFQAASRMFKNPRGLLASSLIAQAGLVGTKVGGAEINDRDANYVVVQQGGTSRDVLRLIDLVRSRVREQSRVELELELDIW